MKRLPQESRDGNEVIIICAICLATPCHSGCPNAPESVPAYECCKCGYGIHSGERYYDSPDGYVCEDCVEDMTVREFMELIGETFTKTEKEEI